MKTNQIPKTIIRWIENNSEKVDDFWLEDDGYGSSINHDYSLWLYLKKGYVNSMKGHHMIHVCLVKDFFSQVKDIEQCCCHQCQEG